MDSCLMVESWIGRSDFEWYLEVMRREALARSLSKERCQEIIDGIMLEAERVAVQLEKKYGCRSARSYAESLGLRVHDTISQMMPDYLYMGLYEPSTRTVTLNKSVLKLAKNYIYSHNLEALISVSNMEELVLYHEIFHALEEITPGIYTRSKLIEKKYLGGVISKNYGLDSASEAGAIHFSKQMSGIAYSPCVYEQILLLATEEQ